MSHCETVRVERSANGFEFCLTGVQIGARVFRFSSNPSLVGGGGGGGG